MLYSFSKDLFENLNLTNLHNSIKNINTKFQSISVDESVDIEFSEELSENEIEELNTILLTYDTTFKPILNYKTFILQDSIKSKTYKKMITFTYPGINNFSKILYIKCISYVTPSDNYYLRIYDTTNKLIIAEKEFNNTTSIINDLGSISNLPKDYAIFELQIKSNSLVSVEELNYYY